MPASSPVGAQAWLLPDSAFASGSAAGSHLVSAVEVLAHSAVENHLRNSSGCEALYKAFAQVLAHACAIQNTSWWMQRCAHMWQEWFSERAEPLRKL